VAWHYEAGVLAVLLCAETAEEVRQTLNAAMDLLAANLVPSFRISDGPLT
jgi:hypothetical protein